MQRSCLPYLMFVVAAVLYALTLSPEVYPGDSARHLSGHLGADPFPALSDPLWGWSIRSVALLSGKSTVAMNGFSALCVALAAGLIAAAVLRMRPVSLFHRVVRPKGVALGALAAALYFAVSKPVWIVATRAHPLAMDLLIVALILYLFSRYYGGDGLRFLFASALVFGIGLVEYSALLVVAPFAGVIALFLLYSRQQLNVKNVAGLAACLLAGLLLYLPAVWQHMGHPSLVWREIEHAGALLWEMWREQYVGVKFSISRTGWLTTLLLTTLPFVMALLYRFREYDQTELDISRRIMIGTMLVLLGAVFLDFRLSPWQMNGAQAIMVAPYVMAALAFGLLLAYVPEVLDTDWMWRRGVPLARAAVLVMVTAGVVMGYATTNGRTGRAVALFADAVVEHAEGRRWLITSGEFDSSIAMAAWQRDQDLVLINLRQLNTKPIRNHLINRMDKNRLQVQLDVSTESFVRALFLDERAPEELAVLASPMGWVDAGYMPVPFGVLYVGTQSTNPVASGVVMESFDAFWERFAAPMADLEGAVAPAAVYAPVFRRHFGRFINNLGFYLEDQGDGDRAWGYYGLARSVDHENLSALMNQLSLARRQERPERTDLEVEWEERRSRFDDGLNFGLITAAFGFVHTPALHVERGRMAARAGDPQAALEEIERGMAAGFDGTGLNMAMAEILRTSGDTERSAEEYQKILDQEPANVAALHGMFRLTMLAGDIDGAKEWLAALKDAGVEADMVAFQEALLEAYEGRYDRALAIIDKLRRDHPRDPRLLLAAMEASFHMGDTGRVERGYQELSRLDNPGIPGHMALAERAMRQGDQDAARGHIVRVLRMQPQHAGALGARLRMAVASGDHEAIQEAARAILVYYPRHALANYFFAEQYIVNEEWELAEATLRISVATRRLPFAINNLAYVLHKLDRAEEGLPLAKEAVAALPGNGAVWDTLAALQMATGDANAALTSINRAIELRPEHAPYERRLEEIRQALAMP